MDPELLKLIMGMQGNRPRSLTPNSLLGGQGMSDSSGQSPQSPVPPQSNPWMTGLGIGSTAMQTAAPVAGMLLNRQRRELRPPNPIVAGSNSVFQQQNPYSRPQQDPRQSMLIRQLLGR